MKLIAAAVTTLSIGISIATNITAVPAQSLLPIASSVPVAVSSTAPHRTPLAGLSPQVSSHDQGQRTILVPFRSERPPTTGSLLTSVGTASPANITAQSTFPKPGSATSLVTPAMPSAVATATPLLTLQAAPAPRLSLTLQPSATPVSKPSQAAQPTPAPKLSPTPQPPPAPKPSPTLQPTQAPKPSPTPLPISAQDLGALDSSAFAAIVGRYVDVNGYVADVLTVADGGSSHHILRLAGSTRADITLACLLPAGQRTDNAAPVTFQAHVHVAGYVLAASDQTVGAASRTAPIVLSPCRVGL